MVFSKQHQAYGMASSKPRFEPDWAPLAPTESETEMNMKRLPKVFTSCGTEPSRLGRKCPSQTARSSSRVCHVDAKLSLKQKEVQQSTKQVRQSGIKRVQELAKLYPTTRNNQKATNPTRNLKQSDTQKRDTFKRARSKKKLQINKYLLQILKLY